MTAVIAALGIVAILTASTDAPATELDDAALPSGVATTAVHRTDTAAVVTSAAVSVTTDLASATSASEEADAPGTPTVPTAGSQARHCAAAYLPDPLQVRTQANVREREAA